MLRTFVRNYCNSFVAVSAIYIFISITASYATLGAINIFLLQTAPFVSLLLAIKLTSSQYEKRLKE
jgi:hypothetical protein